MMRAIAAARTALTTVLLLVALPAVLVHLGAGLRRPTAGDVRAWMQEPMSTGFLTGVVVGAGWLLWAVIAAATVAHVARYRPGRIVGRLHLRLPGPVQGLTAAALGVAAVSTSASGVPADAPAPATAVPDLHDDGHPRSSAHLLASHDGGAHHIAAAEVTGSGRTAERHSGPAHLTHGYGVGTAVAPRAVHAAASDGLRCRDEPHLDDPRGQPRTYDLTRLPPTSTAHPAPLGYAVAAGTAARPAEVTSQARAVVPGEVTLVAGGREYTYTVRRGDSLSEIAEKWLGDADRWPEVFALNRGTHFTDVGGTLANPHLIYPGWTLSLPDDATPPGGHPTEPAKPEGEDPAEPAPGGTATPAPSATSTPATSTPASSAPATPGSPAPTTPAAASTVPPGHDGVIGEVPTTPATSTPSSAAGSPSAERSGPRGVSLLSGSWVDLGMAAAIAAAVALVWAQRRRRYTHRPPSPNPRLDDPDLAPMPSVVAQVRRGLRRLAPPALGDAHEPGGHDPFGDDGRGDEARHQPSAADRLAEDDDGEVTDPAAPPDVAPAPVVPALANPLSAVWPPAGLGLTGPGAEAAARGFLTAGLAAGGLEDPDARTWVVMPSATAATLLGAAAVSLPNTPRLTVTAGLDEALELLETQTLHRTRLVYRHEVDDVTALRHADALTEHLPPIMLIAGATTRHERTRITAVLAQGQRLDIHGVLLGPWPDGNTIVVAADGTTTAAERDAARHGSHPADVGRFAILDPAETADLFRTLAESHTGQPPAPAPAAATLPRPPTTDTAHPVGARPQELATADEPAKDAGGAPSDRTNAVNTSNEAETVEPGPGAPRDTPAPDRSASTPVAGAGTAAEEDAPPPGRVDVTVLGGPGIVDADPQRKPRKKSLELLVYLAVHNGSAAAEAILDDLLPDASAKAAPHRLHTYVSDLRAVLRHNGGPGTYITNPNKHYALDRATVDIDLWHMRAALKDADVALTPQERTAALRRAVDTYTGPLAADCDYEWVEPYREAVRRQAFDAASALAEALDGHPEQQLAVLTAAIGHHRYAEELYQAAMRAQAQLGQPDAVRSLRRTLTRRLAEIDAEPSDDTITLADQLVAQLQRPGRAVRLRPAPDPGDGAAA